jgi:hypothetical protein
MFISPKKYKLSNITSCYLITEVEQLDINHVLWTIVKKQWQNDQDQRRYLVYQDIDKLRVY